MLTSLRRKAAQVGSDPVLRRWLFERMTGREKGTPPGAPRWPPYLSEVAKSNGPVTPTVTAFPACDFAGPSDHPIDIALPGAPVHLDPSTSSDLFTRPYSDMEHVFAVHRFAWAPLSGRAIDRVWLARLWCDWMARYATPSASPAWHPYTAAERAINILEFAKDHGLPGPADETIRVLADHGRSILGSLEYFGEAATGNHLSNNGRGLYLLGLALGIGEYADMGGRILVAESERIFAPSGILREGSSHYHLLLTRNYASAWLAAREHHRPEEPALRDTTMRALGVLAHLDLPAGMPLIGDVSPDCPPDFLTCLLPSGDVASGWLGSLDDASRSSVLGLRDASETVAADRLADDGWHRLDTHDWSALWHVAPLGWPPIPGHAHQDMASFELHFDGARLVVDPGRGAYDDRGDAGAYVGASVHNGLTIDGADPYPQNRPYYSDDYRRRVCGPPPVMRCVDGSVSLTHFGFSRLEGVAETHREWRFSPERMTVIDTIVGSGRHMTTRTLHTPGQVTRDGKGVSIKLGSRKFRLLAAGEVSIEPATYWREYGKGDPSSLIRIRLESELPVELLLTITVE